jgi:hypothetical protein
MPSAAARSELVASLASSALLFGPVHAERLVTTPDGSCLAGAHEMGRIRRQPGAPATSHGPRNPTEDHFVHCSDALADDAPADSPGSLGPTPEPRRRPRDVRVEQDSLAALFRSRTDPSTPLGP